MTFLFSDIAGSTRLWERYPLEMDSALERHDDIVRTEIGEHDGYIFATAGDGYGVAFRRAEDAVAAAVGAQHRLQAEAWAENTPIEVRMGLHTGEASERGGDYFGSSVNRAARIMAAANGGQIVISHTTFGNAARWPLLTFVDLGDHLLKDLADPAHLWQVYSPDLRGEFPPLQSLSTYNHNLPSRLEPLVGRQRELAELTELLAESRLVTLVGPGGMGKTRLSLQIVADFVDQCSDGVWFIDLVPAEANVDSVAEAIGRAMGFDARKGQSWSSTVVAALTVRDVLLVFDNCEHVLGEVIELTRRLLDEAPGVRILTTSRERLELKEERLYPLGPLDAGPELFITRAQALNPQFDSASSRSAIEELCQRLDGLPLGIELAAARIRSLQPEEIVTRLDERFRLLRSRDRTADQRHQTLSATLDWSLQQLPAEARELFHRLGVFKGDFDLAAAYGMADEGSDELDVADLIDELEAKSMVVAVRSTGTTRYRLLETMAAYAVMQLDRAGEIDATLRRHGQMRAALTTERARALDDPDRDQVAAFNQLRADLIDIESAFAWGCRHDPSTAEEIFAAIRNLAVSGVVGMSRARALSVQILGLWDATRCSDLSAATACLVLSVNGDGETADVVARKILVRQDLSEPTRAIALTVAAWGEIVLRDDIESAVALAEQALAAASAIADGPLLALARMNGIIQLVHAGRFERATELADENERLPVLASLGHSKLLLLHAAATALRHDDLRRSTAHLESSARLAEAFGNKQYMTWVRYHVALNRLAGRESAEAADDLVAVLPGLLDRGDPLILALAFGDLANAFYRTGALASAATSYSIADKELAAQGATGHDAYVQRRQRHLARLHEQLGQEAFEAAWGEGEDLTVDEAVRHMQLLHRT